MKHFHDTPDGVTAKEHRTAEFQRWAAHRYGLDNTGRPAFYAIGKTTHGRRHLWAEFADYCNEPTVAEVLTHLKGLGGAA
jgi:hypothetical protein